MNIFILITREIRKKSKIESSYQHTEIKILTMDNF